MSNLVTITSKFYDRSGRRVINLNVMSRYQGSKRENLQKTDLHGQFVFQASPQRTVEILAKPPNQKDFTVFKVIHSSIGSSSQDPIKIQLPKTIEEYKQSELGETKARIVTTTFKVVDCAGKVVSNFPIQSYTHYKIEIFKRSKLSNSSIVITNLLTGYNISYTISTNKPSDSVPLFANIQLNNISGDNNLSVVKALFMTKY